MAGVLASEGRAHAAPQPRQAPADVHEAQQQRAARRKHHAVHLRRGQPTNIHVALPAQSLACSAMRLCDAERASVSRQAQLSTVRG